MLLRGGSIEFYLQERIKEGLLQPSGSKHPRHGLI
jgi:hypothetical protein